MKVSRAQTLILLGITLALPGGTAYGQQPRDDAKKVTAAVVRSKPATVTRRYACRISSHRHIEVRAPEDGYLQEVAVGEGQAAKKGDVLFRFAPVIHRARRDSELAEVRIAELELGNAKRLFDRKVISEDELKLQAAKLDKARARAKLAEAESGTADVKAPFDGLIGRLPRQQGSLVLKGEALTDLFDNGVVRAYFDVPEATYLEHMAGRGEDRASPEVKLILAGNTEFPHAGKIGAIEAAFNSGTGTIAFRADFPNPEGLLRHGQTGNVLIHRTLKDAVVIPQRATFELLDKRYVYVVGEDHVAHQRLIAIQHELEDKFIVRSGLDAKDKIVLEGVREVRDGDKVDYEFRKPEDVLSNQKHHAE
jgi:membrane fusion protein (multidrug efflux system)